MHEKPNGYPFLAELDACPADEISIEAAQPRLDPSLLEQLPSKRVILGVLDLNDMEVESPEVVADRIRAALGHIDPERLMVGPDCGMKYLPREVARGKLRSLVERPRSFARICQDLSRLAICYDMLMARRQRLVQLNDELLALWTSGHRKPGAPGRRSFAWL